MGAGGAEDCVATEGCSSCPCGPPPRVPANSWPGFPFGFWVLASACQRHGVGGFVAHFLFFLILLL